MCDTDITSEGGGKGVGCRVWGVGCGVWVWGVGCGVSGVGCLFPTIILVMIFKYYIIIVHTIGPRQDSESK